MAYAPIVLFTYNRPLHLRRTVEALQNNSLALESNLIIFQDGLRTSKDREKYDCVNKYIHEIKGFKSVEIIERKENWGLAKSIIAGVTQIVNEYGNIIVLEDDLVTNPFFLTYMNSALEKYQDQMDVASIHGFVLPIDDVSENFFIKGADCWGWATWQRAWQIFEPDSKKLIQQFENNRMIKDFNFDGTFGYYQMLREQAKGYIDSWAIRWHASAYLKNMLTLYPGKSLVEHIGYDQGQHHKGSGRHACNGILYDQEIKVIDIPVSVDHHARQNIVSFWRQEQPNIAIRIIRSIVRTLR